MPFPVNRPRRLRQSETLRRLVRETTLTPADLIYPLFVIFGQGVKNPVQAMPGIYQYSVDQLLYEVEEVAGLRLPGVILFGIPEKKDNIGSEAWNPDGPVQQAVKAIKARFPEILVITDVCLCEYTAHGHCGVVDGQRVLNDPTLEFIARTALSHAEAGADVVAPSDMMDGRVKAIREKLDAHGFIDTPILTYAAKYASAFYGPFREAAGSAPAFGDRRTYQMDPGNAREAMREISLDLEEGADMVMVKPALAYLDIIHLAREHFNCPIAAYNVSGEYAMIKAAAAAGYVDEQNIVWETLTAIKRAGADFILTYFAKDVARWMQDSGKG
ncbi:MAG: porphobilinogen synthase [Clostridia bacterium]|nr:MAG: porphobilinogen synthase [Clostridia bacterium]